MFGFLTKFFEKPETVVPLPDLSFLKVDMHSHLIPGIDDGVKSVIDSVDCCKAFYNMGIKKIITTPHVMADGYCNTPEIILKGRDEVRAALNKENIPIEFDAAAEYYLDENYADQLSKNNLLTFGDKYVLVELSYMFKPNNILDLIYKTQSKGYRFVLAHPERYPFFYEKDFATYFELKERSVYFQLNIGSIIGMYGKRAMEISHQLIDKNLVDFVSSDLHHLGHFDRFKPVLSSPYLRKISESSLLKNKTLI